VKALILDDHMVARRGLRTILQESFALDECYEVENPQAALRLATECEPDLVLLDMHIPNSSPTHELCRQLRSVLPRSRIVIVTAFDSVPEITDCLEAGADGCLLKDTSELDFTRALRAIRAGETVIDPRIVQRLASELLGRRSGGTGVVRLTNRERDVLALIAEGCSNRAISARLLLSEATVKGYVSSLLEKLDASSRLEALVRASEAGLI
jgi:DNA-binding NarL/FixJ family response regulator